MKIQEDPRLEGSKWGQIKIQEDPGFGARHAITKFCSDPFCVVSDASTGEMQGGQSLQPTLLG